MPYEMLRYSPEPLRGAVLDGVILNAILTKQAPPPSSWLGGQIRSLFKKGDQEGGRPQCVPTVLQARVLTGLRVQALVGDPHGSLILPRGTARLAGPLTGGAS